MGLRSVLGGTAEGMSKSYGIRLVWDWTATGLDRVDCSGTMRLDFREIIRRFSAIG